jgi:hypothetical protein
MNYILEVKREADLELTSIFSYYDSISNNLGDKFLDSWELAIKKVCKNPLGFEIKHKKFRQALISKFPYLIIFEIHDNAIVVYAIIHAKKHPVKRYKKAGLP